ncbi:hypothetical protein ASPZODRAFT_142649 [Penicilliopsis zonata CBS 506.65]|uniref:Uncharacterized protein n=1 Tax=Penicilliopsis zonata CBS 506.65 TaxID=1073090 RepID=A0A1L9SFW0_9EURO|nr:hypothetical protein ASPZODRAFT_142649 [Penicilliopsis zonata CBS 506.65]OJJ46013.1 hypothetical protein ASPZODRAFT_142649 [Penicilliopsis zonata CBS 506.65]
MDIFTVLDDFRPCDETDRTDQLEASFPSPFSFHAESYEGSLRQLLRLVPYPDQDGPYGWVRLIGGPYHRSFNLEPYDEMGAFDYERMIEYVQQLARIASGNGNVDRFDWLFHQEWYTFLKGQAIVYLWSPHTFPFDQYPHRYEDDISDEEDSNDGDANMPGAWPEDEVEILIQV